MAGIAGPNVLLLDLRTGRHRLIHLGDDRSVRFVRWLPDSRTLQAFANRAAGSLGTSSTHLVDVRGGSRLSPYGRHAVGYEPDGTAVRFTPTHRLRWAHEGAAPIKEPTPGLRHLQSRSWTVEHGVELSAVPVLRERAMLDDLLAIESQSMTPVARLVNRRGGFVGAGESLGITYGWLDAGTLLTSTSSWIVTWEPRAGELRRVVRTPRVPPHVWAGWDASFALDLLRPPRRGSS